jgi:hypothetical protein
VEIQLILSRSVVTVTRLVITAAALGTLIELAQNLEVSRS